MPFCAATTNHCCIGIKQNYKPCCRYSDSENFFPISQYSFQDYKNTEFFVNLKQELSQAWPAGCVRCQDEERHGLVSLRQRYNDRMSGELDKLEFLELSISNHCNLTCKMCDNFSSSKWQHVLDSNNELLKYDFGKEVKPSSKFWIEHVFQNLNLDHLHTVKYLGGEPFITPELDKLIDFFIEKGIIEKINFRCNTNCTFYPKKLIDKLLKFKSVRIDLSIDGINELCNFIRTGEQWSTVSKVVGQWVDLRSKNQKVTLILHHTSQALNIHQFDLIKKFAKDKDIQFSYSILNHPNYLNFTVLPKNYVTKLTTSQALVDEKLISILNKVSYSDSNHKKFISYVDDTDKVLNTDFKSTIPLFYDCLDLT